MNDVTDLEPVTVRSRKQVGASRTIVNLARSSDERLAGYVSLTSSLSAQVFARKRQDARNHGKAAQTSGGIKSRFTARFSAKHLQDLATSMKDSAIQKDLVALANAGFDLIDELDNIWRLSKRENPAQADTANLLRTALTRHPFERLTPENCEAIRRFIDQCIVRTPIDETDLHVALRLLKRAGLNPWKVFAGSDVEGA